MPVFITPKDSVLNSVMGNELNTVTFRESNGWLISYTIVLSTTVRINRVKVQSYDFFIQTTGMRSYLYPDFRLQKTIPADKNPFSDIANGQTLNFAFTLAIDKTLYDNTRSHYRRIGLKIGLKKADDPNTNWRFNNTNFYRTSTSKKLSKMKPMFVIQ